MKSRGIFAALLAGIALSCAAPPRHVERAVSLERQAEAALAAGDSERALAIYRDAAERWRKAGQHKILAATLDNIARIHKDRGDFDLAVDAWQQALSVAKFIQDTDTVLRTLGNLGMAYSAWGRYPEALDLYQQSLDLAKTLKHEPSVARIYNNIGAVYRQWGKLDQAIEHYEKALAIDRRLKDEAAIATRTANIATVYMDRGDYERARDHYEIALRAARKEGNEDKIAIRLNNLGAVRFSLGDYEGALKHYQEALKLHKKLGQRHQVATVLSNMGSAFWYLERYDEAEGHLVPSIDLKEQLRQGATGDIRRDYLASQIDTYEWLTATYVDAGAPKKALLTADSSRAKYLIDQLKAAGSKVGIGDTKALAERFLARLPQEMTVVFFSNAGWNQLIRFVATRGGVTATKIDTSEMLARLAPSSKRADAASLKGNQAALEGAVRAYRRLLISTAQSDVEERSRQARVLFDSLLGGDPALSSARHLLILPDRSLAFVPFETLRTPEGRYLIEERLVTYTPSLAVSELLQQREGSRGDRSLLAMGDARYESAALKASLAKLDEKLLEARRRQARGLDLVDQDAPLGQAGFEDLPGTRREVVGLGQIVPKTSVVLGSDVTEARIKGMSKTGDLAKYRVLHFATHGVAFPEAPSLSALVLSQTGAAQQGEDGFLTMGEIAKLAIDADQVVLSACDTGLGKLYAGEGVVGLTQAFFVAGARAVSVSLWQVPDDSTAELMLHAYATMQTKGQRFAVAMAEAKRAFIHGSVGGGRFAAPHHWAPFVHYGAWDTSSPRAR
ncbi:MAG TPA: CHAT domain-containing tetratricopeptide repeat protein [Polyangiaceae bacterium]|jgi:CHAT domain-containing protein/tetratricopeptide (TPR) repeat protein|nr:CHAT domain-containing tetratricopeptide repeat protein [Polyangiaceae bacterium]